jgi:hypothetical protein
MRKYIIFLFLNVVLFLMLQFGVVLTAFLLGLASSDKYVREQWILYWLFCLIHVTIFVAIPYIMRSLLVYKFLVGVLLIILSWVITAWYISN